MDFICRSVIQSVNNINDTWTEFQLENKTKVIFNENEIKKIQLNINLIKSNAQ